MRVHQPSWGLFGFFLVVFVVAVFEGAGLDGGEEGEVFGIGEPEYVFDAVGEGHRGCCGGGCGGRHADIVIAVGGLVEGGTFRTGGRRRGGLITPAPALVLADIVDTEMKIIFATALGARPLWRGIPNFSLNSLFT